MTDSISHRGPDGFGYYRDAWASLGHRRLSIVDVAGGGQPMCNEDGSIWISYNGEVFNHADLRGFLERAGHRYRSRCDTETLIHAYENYGVDSLARYRGMFSFAVWDKDKRELFCARDRLGIKPFYYYWDGRLFAFASEIKALLAHPVISAAMDESAFCEYLAFGYLSDERTLFAGIRQLMPGHWLRLRITGQPSLEIRSYWDPPVDGDYQNAAPESEDRYIRECRQRLEETVHLRLMSDVPLGMFLSGGIDSSAIAALMKRMVSGPVDTFAVGYREAPYSELDHARHVARHLNTRHHEVIVNAQDFFSALPHLIWHEDEPIAWPSSVSLYFVSKLAAQMVKVVLTGEGSDELFGGYARYRHYLQNETWMRLYRLVPSSLRSALRRALAGSSLLSASLRRKLQHTVLGRGEDLPSLYLDNFYCAFSREQQANLLTGSPPLPNAPYESYLRYWASAAGSTLLSRLLYADQKTYLPELLRKQDRMSMACSIESRVPFLDHLFVEFAARVPDRLKIWGATTKYILKRAVEDLLPVDIIHRKKMGFPTPLQQWLLEKPGAFVYPLLRNPKGFLAAHIDGRNLDDLLERHQKGQEDATDRIWRLLNLQIWADTFLTGRREKSQDACLTGAA